MEYTVNHASLLSDLDSLTEPSLESLSGLMASAAASGAKQQTKASARNAFAPSMLAMGGVSGASIGDEMMLLRLIDMQSAADSITSKTGRSSRR